MNNQIIDLLHQFNTFEEIQNNVEDVNMMGAAAGIYQVRLLVGSELHSLRFVKQ